MNKKADKTPVANPEDDAAVLVTRRVRLDELHADPGNTNTHDALNLRTIRDSLVEFGQVEPLVIRKDTGKVIGGNGRLDVMRDLGWTECNVVEFDGSEVRATALAIALNRTAKTSAFDDDALARTLQALMNEGFDLAATGFSEEEANALIDGLGSYGSDDDGEPAEDPGPQIDRAAELQERWGTASGQLWLLPSKSVRGKEHRLLCGDCRNPEDLARLCPDKVQGAFTSPPYAEQRKEQYGGTPADEYVDWWEQVQAGVRSVLLDDGSFFVNIKPHCEDGERSLYVMDLVTAMKRRWGWRYEEEFAWVHNGTPKRVQRKFKNAWESVYHFALSYDLKFRPDDVRHDSENVPIWSPETGSRGAKRAVEVQGRVGAVEGCEVEGGLAYPSNVIKASMAGEAVGHTAAFPVDLPTFFLKAFSDPGDTWLEPFSGSGTTTVAAEQTGRICYAMELAPKFVAVALERLMGLGLVPYRA